MKSRDRRKRREKLKLIKCNPNAPTIMSKQIHHPLFIKAAVMGSKRPDIAPTNSDYNQFFTLGEACEIVDIEPHVLRYWELIFPVIKSETIIGDRMYQHKDLEIIMRIKELLYRGYDLLEVKTKLEEDLRQNY